MASRAAGSHIFNHDTKPYISLVFYIYHSLHHLFEASWYLVLLFYFNLDEKFEAFLKVVDHNWLIQDLNSVKLCQKKLVILEVWCPVLGLFQLVLRVSFKLILNIIDKSLKIPKVFLEKGFEIRPNNRKNTFMAILVLNLSEVNNITKVLNSKQGIIYLSNT